ncbi:MAG: hypothetical protein R2755_02560 [Acidimicrobiales bacterium]
MDSNEDAYLIEGGVYQVRDAATETWASESEKRDRPVGQVQELRLGPGRGHLQVIVAKGRPRIHGRPFIRSGGSGAADPDADPRGSPTAASLL